MDRYSYYMIRIYRSPVGPQPEPPLTGVVERLGSGEKESFTDGEQLLRLLNGWNGWNGWSEGAPNLGPVPGTGKA